MNGMNGNGHSRQNGESGLNVHVNENEYEEEKVVEGTGHFDNFGVYKLKENIDCLDEMG